MIDIFFQTPQINARHVSTSAGGVQLNTVESLIVTELIFDNALTGTQSSAMSTLSYE